MPAIFPKKWIARALMLCPLIATLALAQHPADERVWTGKNGATFRGT